MQNNRKDQILHMLHINRSIQVSKLSKYFGVSEKTIRLDLNDMEEKGLLKRVHGGAIALDKNTELVNSREKYVDNEKAKELIAERAFDFLNSFDEISKIIFLDSGTTTRAFSLKLRDTFNTIITNDLQIANNLINMQNQFHLTGGELQSNFNAYFAGPDAISMINKHNADICFLGCSSISIGNGFNTQTNVDAEIKRAMISRSNIVVCLADHTKLEKTSFVRFADFSDIDYLITDMLTKEQFDKLSSTGIKIISSVPARE